MGTELLPSFWRKEIARKLKAFSFHFLVGGVLAILAILSQAISGLRPLSCLIMHGVSIDLLLVGRACQPARVPWELSVGRVAR